MSERVRQGESEFESVDRRRSARYPIEREIRFIVSSRRKIGNDTGTGKTINISSNGILFATNQDLIAGSRIKLAVDWPVRLENNCQLKLVAFGRVVRCDNGTAAVEIEQYEFRTRGTQPIDFP